MTKAKEKLVALEQLVEIAFGGPEVSVNSDHTVANPTMHWKRAYNRLNALSLDLAYALIMAGEALEYPEEEVKGRTAAVRTALDLIAALPLTTKEEA